MALLWTHSNIVSIVLVLGAPDLDMVLQVGSHKSRIEGKNLLSRVAGHFSFDAAAGCSWLSGLQVRVAESC